MAELSETAASLRFIGDTLDPDELTHRLGAEPTSSARKGGPVSRPNGTVVIAPRGWWSLKVEYRSPGDLDGQIAEILERLTDDLSVWQDLSGRFRAEIFCGLFLREGNEGLALAPATMLALGMRGLQLEMDIYVREQSAE